MKKHENEREIDLTSQVEHLSRKFNNDSLHNITQEEPNDEECIWY